jgi:hypothetical protein
MNENTHSSVDPLFVYLREDDPALLAASTEARQKQAQFKAAFSERRFKSAAYLVKVPFVDRGDVGQPFLVGTSKVVADNPTRPITHLWLAVTSMLDGLLFCSVGEAPKQFGLKKGESFVIREELAEDWMITHEGVAYGGFSLRASRNRLGEIDKRRFDERTGIHEFKQDLS